MSGTYIIGGSQGVYSDLDLAAQALQQNGMSGPVIFKVYPGTYYGQIFLNNNSSTNTYANKLTIESLSGKKDDVVLTSDNQVIQNSYIIQIGDFANVEIRNIKFIPTGLFSTCIKSGNNNNIKLKIEGCTFFSCGCQESLSGYSIYAGAKDTIYIVNNSFNGCRAISTYGDLMNINTNNFYNNKYNGVIWGGKNFIGGNLIFSNNRILSENSGKWFVESSYNTNSLTAQNNIFILKGKWSLAFFTQTFDSTCSFYNNIIISDSGSGINTTNASLINNTIITKNYVYSDVDHVNEMKNNILISTEGPLFYANSTLGTVNSDYNLLYSLSTASFCEFFDTNVTSIPDYAAWKQIGMDSHSQWGIPLFTKPYDFHLQPGNTLALGAGTPITGLLYDIEGDLRDALNPDIGADEVVIRPILDTAYNACIGSSFTLDAGAGFTSYLWSNNATTQTITLPSSTASATYSCTVTYGGNSGSKSTTVHWVNCSSINSITKSDYKVLIYPNPFTDKLTLQLPETLLSAEVLLYNVVGKQVMHCQVSSSPTTINTSELKSGIYLIKVVADDGNVFVGKVVKQ